MSLIANLSNINSTIIDMYIVSTPGYDEENEINEEVSYNFTWTVTDMKDEIMLF